MSTFGSNSLSKVPSPSGGGLGWGRLHNACKIKIPSPSGGWLGRGRLPNACRVKVPSPSGGWLGRGRLPNACKIKVPSPSGGWLGRGRLPNACKIKVPSPSGGWLGRGRLPNACKIADTHDFTLSLEGEGQLKLNGTISGLQILNRIKSQGLFKILQLDHCLKSWFREMEANGLRGCFQSPFHP